jgi:hypothetical protein
MFKKNEGILDRIARVSLGLVLLPTGLVLLGALQGSVVGPIVSALGVVGLVTGVTGFCPTYTLFGFSTLDMEKGLIQRCKAMMSGRGAGACMGAGRMCGPSQGWIDEAPKPET